MPDATHSSPGPTMWSSVLFHGLAGTFLRAPHVPPEAEAIRESRAGAAIYGMPWDSMAVTRSGASYGPRAIREATTLFLPYNATWDFDIQASLGLVDLGDCLTVVGNPEKTFERAQAELAQVLEAGAIPVVLGGDHSVTIPAVRAVADVRPGAGLVLIDAHLDTATDVGGEILSNCCPVSRAIDAGFDPRKTVLVGIGGWMNPREELEYCREHGITVIWLDDVWRMGTAAVVERVLEIAGGDDGLYLTVDVDAMDGAFGPGTSTPGPSGLTSREMLEIVRGVSAGGLLGLDVVETAPSLEHGERTANMAARIALDALAAHCGAVA
jgi:guanidinobutyrase